MDNKFLNSSSFVVGHHYTGIAMSNKKIFIVKMGCFEYFRIGDR